MTYEMMKSSKALEKRFAFKILEDAILEPFKFQFPRRRYLLGDAILREILRIVKLLAFHRQGCPLCVENEKLVEVFYEVICYLYLCYGEGLPFDYPAEGAG
jgi:hypothetical protein